jgi:ribosomal protein S27AE
MVSLWADSPSLIIKKKEKIMNENEVRKCPKCGNEMEKGYVKLSEGIRWRTGDHRRGELLRWGTAFLPRDYAAYLCRKCHYVLLSYL